MNIVIDKNIGPKKSNWGEWFWPIFWPLFYLMIFEVFMRAENPSLMTDDSGETVTSAFTLGIPHPPGYPLFNLIGRLATFVPLGTIAFRLNCLSAIFTLSALMFLIETCRRFLKEQVKEASGVCIGRNAFEWFLVSVAASFCFCQTVLAQSLTAKGGIYTLTLSFLSCMLMVYLKPGNVIKKYIFLFYLFGLGVSNHWETSILWFPFLVLSLKNFGFRWNLKTGIHFLNFFIIGISVYLYLPIRAKLKPDLNFLNPVNWGSFWQLISRNYYSGSGGESHHYWSQITNYWNVLLFHWWPGFIVFAMLGFCYLYVNAKKVFSVFAVLYFLIVFFVVFYPSYTSENLFFIGIYLVSTEGVVAFFAFCSIFSFSKFKKQWVGMLMVFLSLACSLYWCVFSFGRQDKSWFLLESDYGFNLLKQLPENSVFLSDGDEDIMSMMYLTDVMHQRPDVTIIPAFLLTSGWGFVQVLDYYGRDLNLSSENVRGFNDAINEVVRECSKSGRPLFYSHDKALLDRFKTVDFNSHLLPWGLTYKYYQVFPSNKQISDEVYRMDFCERLRHLNFIEDLSTEIPSSFYLNSYARSDVLVADYFIGQNDFVDAFKHFQKALDINGKMRGVYLSMAWHFQKSGDLELAKILCLKELTIDPKSAESYFLMGNIYFEMNDFKKSVLNYDCSLDISPDSEEAKRNRYWALEAESSGEKKPWRPESESYFKRMKKKFNAQGLTLLASLVEMAARNGGGD